MDLIKQLMEINNELTLNLVQNLYGSGNITVIASDGLLSIEYSFNIIDSFSLLP